MSSKSREQRNLSQFDNTKKPLEERVQNGEVFCPLFNNTCFGYECMFWAKLKGGAYGCLIQEALMKYGYS